MQLKTLVEPINRNIQRTAVCIYINGCWNPTVQAQHLHIVLFIIIFIMIMIISIIMTDYDCYDYYLKRLF